MDKIIIKEAHFMCNLGVPNEERKKKQEIIVDVELFLNAEKMALPFFPSDDIKSTIDYSKAYNLIKQTVEGKEYRLIEAIAENLANKILDKFPVKQALVRVKKPKALAGRNVKYAAVEIIRDKNDILPK